MFITSNKNVTINFKEIIKINKIYGGGLENTLNKIIVKKNIM